MLPERKVLQSNMATSSEKDQLIEKIYEYQGEFYKIIENADFHNRLHSSKLRIVKLHFINDFYNLIILFNLSFSLSIVCLHKILELTGKMF